jgi:threonine dehydrogenase-like Zn-dependent dehydrogenase
MGHEYAGVVQEAGAEVTTIKPGQFVIGSFFASDGTCPNCRAGYPSSCVHREFVGGCQAEAIRVPLADGTLVAVPGQPADEVIPSLQSLSDVMSTGWWAATAAEVRPGSTVAVVGDGAVEPCGVIAARELGAGRTWVKATAVFASELISGVHLLPAGRVASTTRRRYPTW